MTTPHNMKQMQGFTLVELLIIIVIIGILSAIATPSMMNIIRKNQLQQETRDLVAVLNEARSEAVLKRATISVNWTAKKDIRSSSSGANKATLTMTYNMMGRAGGLTFSNSVSCLTLTHGSDSAIVNSVAIYQQGAVRVFKNKNSCS